MPASQAGRRRFDPGRPLHFYADWIKLAVGAYRKHVELTGDELERLEAVMYIRPLYLGCFSYRRDLVNGRPPGDEVWGFVNPEHIGKIAAATRSAFR